VVPMELLPKHAEDSIMNKGVVQFSVGCFLLRLIIHGKGKGKGHPITDHPGPREGVVV
jgi:hypothetical protein